MYSFTGSIPSHINTVAIPLFDDNTSFPGVREDLTNKVIDRFIAENVLQVVPESNADLLITGTILSIQERAAIIEYDGGISRHIAEPTALICVLVNIIDRYQSAIESRDQ